VTTRAKIAFVVLYLAALAVGIWIGVSLYDSIAGTPTPLR